jgi:hypothetical protein
VPPFLQEASTFRFVLLTVGGLAAVAAAARAAGTVAALVVLAVVIAAALVGQRRQRRPDPEPAATAVRGSADGERRILVVANETVGGGRLFEEIGARSDGYREHILILCPALNSPLRFWTSDEDGARTAAQSRLQASLRRLAAAGIDARGEIGDADPLQAIEDALRTFDADEIIISTHPPERSNWLERGVVSKARVRFPLPITHVVGEADREAAAAGEDLAPSVTPA